MSSEAKGCTDAYRSQLPTVFEALGTDPDRGLDDGEAKRRLEARGRNELEVERPLSAWRKLLAQFQDTLVILLLVATAISAGLWLFEGRSGLPYEAIAILSIVLLNALMGYVQEARAEQAVAALREMSAASATVLR